MFELFWRRIALIGLRGILCFSFHWFLRSRDRLWFWRMSVVLIFTHIRELDDTMQIGSQLLAFGWIFQWFLHDSLVEFSDIEVVGILLIDIKNDVFPLSDMEDWASSGYLPNDDPLDHVFADFFFGLECINLTDRSALIAHRTEVMVIRMIDVGFCL